MSSVPQSPTVAIGDTILCLLYADLLPPLDDIAARQAVIVPIEIDEARNVIDGATVFFPRSCFALMCNTREAA